jgi:tetratricopeptide (TPR) repeat protein
MAEETKSMQTPRTPSLTFSVAALPALAFLSVLALCPGRAQACLWDHDTLEMERQAFPDALELMTGRFLRHSKAFYAWRVEDREKKLKLDPKDLRLRDDLAVAYEKTGQGEKAIELTLETAKLVPDRYETEANLGTFYIHAGDYEKGLAHIRRAIEINPEAHFGRELIQQRLVEYVVRKRDGGPLRLPLSTVTRGTGVGGFAAYLLQRAAEKGPTTEAAEALVIAAGVKGVLGMMRFGNYDSPVLLEALGDLLVAERGKSDGARRLAARAYLKAGMSQTGIAAESYRLLAKSALISQTVYEESTVPLRLPVVEKAFQKEMEEAQVWYAQVMADEKAWIAAGGDVDASFAKKYYPGQDAAAKDAGEAAGAPPGR